MGLAFDRAYFEDGEAGFHGYRNFPHFDERAAWLVEQYGTDVNLAEIGAGYGYLIQHLRARGMMAAVGYDASGYVVGADPGCADLVVQADAGIVDLAGHDPVVSWNLLDCLQGGADAALVVTRLEAHGAKQLHVLCTDDDADAGSYAEQGYLIRPITFWQSLFTTDGAILVEYRSKDVWRLESGVWSTVTGLAVPLSWGRVTD